MPSPMKNPAKAKSPAATAVTSAAIATTPDKKSLPPAKIAKLEDLAKQIRERQGSLDTMWKTAAEKTLAYMDEAASCGNLLVQCKQIVGHGGWLKWIEEHCKMSANTAQRYMRLAGRKTLSNTARAQYLAEPKSIRQAYALLSPSRKRTGSKPGKGDSGQETGDDAVKKVAAMAKKLFAALQALPPGKRNDACEALGEVNKWLKDSAIDV